MYVGSAWDNRYNESFNGTLRRKALNGVSLTTIDQARTVIGNCLK
ncbi:MAG: integrase core domain-containing protein [Methyloligellaceae bacterium]